MAATYSVTDLCRTALAEAVAERRRPRGHCPSLIQQLVRLDAQNQALRREIAVLERLLTAVERERDALRGAFAS